MNVTLRKLSFNPQHISTVLRSLWLEPFLPPPQGFSCPGELSLSFCTFIHPGFKPSSERCLVCFCFLLIDLTNYNTSQLNGWISTLGLIGGLSALRRGLRWTQVEVDGTLLISRRSASPSEAPSYIWNARRMPWTDCELPRVFPNSARCLALTTGIYIICVAPGREIKINNAGFEGNGSIFLAKTPLISYYCVF